TEVLARGKTDDQGRFRLTHQIAPGKRSFLAYVLTGGKGSALTVAPLFPRNRDEKPPQRDRIELKVEPEQVFRGRMFDLQGIPARGVKGRVVSAAPNPDPNSRDRAVLGARQQMQFERMATGRPREFVVPQRTPGGIEFRLPEPPAEFALWPRTFTTDA